MSDVNDELLRQLRQEQARSDRAECERLRAERDAARFVVEHARAVMVRMDESALKRAGELAGVRAECERLRGELGRLRTVLSDARPYLDAAEQALAAARRKSAKTGGGK